MWVAGAVVVVGMVGSRVAVAQAVAAPESHRWAVGVSGDVGSISKVFDAACGSGNEGSDGYSGSLLFRPNRWLVLEGAVRRQHVLGNYGCDLVLPIYQIGPNEYETRDSTFTAPRAPLTETFLRAGFETPETMPLIRASLGAGEVWHSRIPVGSFAVGMGTRGGGARLYVELETFVSRLHALENHHPFATDSAGSTALGSYSVARTLHPRWSTLHVGIELPLFT